METTRTLEELTAATERIAPAGTVVTVGVFDGLHLGHQALVRRTVHEAAARGLAALVVTFAEHPLAVLAPPYCPKRLLYADRKRQLLAGMGVGLLAELTFTHDFAALPPEEFAGRVLVDACRARVVVCGYDFAFGRDGAGKVELLRELGAAAGFETVVLDAVTRHDLVVKSTAVRDLIYAGHVETAARMLSRPFELRGTVVAGFGRGRQIGFPTANLAVELSQVIPARGVYFCLAAVPGRAGSFGAMINIGTNPTFGLGRLSIEAHLLDFEGDLVGATVSLFFVHRLRDERKFESVEALVDQLRRDKDHARRLLDAPETRALAALVEPLVQGQD